MKEKSNEKTTKSELLIYIFIILLTIAKSIGLSSNSIVYIIMFGFGLFLSLFKIYHDSFSKREILLLLSGLGISTLLFVFGQETSMLFTCLILICLKNIDIHKILKIMFNVKTVIYAGIIVLTLIGIINNNSLVVYRNGEYVERFSFIFGHPNNAHLNLSLIIILWIYLYYDKINIFNIIILELLNYWIYTFTLSRTGFLITSFFLLFSLIYKKNGVIKKISNMIASNGFIYMFIITIIAGYLYNRVSFLSVVDNVMTGRLYYINYFLNNISFPLIGKASYGSLMIDNGYISILYNGGIMALFWFGYIASKTSKILYKNSMNKELLITLILLIYSFSESFYMNAILNVSILFFTYYIFNNNMNNKIHKKGE